MSTWKTIFTLLVLVGCGRIAEAGGITTLPPGLTPGSAYRLLFITGGAYCCTDATSTNINDYNNFGTTAADSVFALLSLGATWTVIGSTPAVDALTNIGGPNADPIYSLAGLEIDNGTAGLFSGVLLNSTDIDQDGESVGQSAWTGSNPDGTQTLGFELGSDTPVIGVVGDLTASWLNFSTDTNTNQHGLYVISSELTVPATDTVPEPSTMWMCLAGGLAVLSRLRLRRGR